MYLRDPYATSTGLGDSETRSVPLPAVARLPAGWNPSTYLAINRDVADLIRAGRYPTAEAHYLAVGAAQNRRTKWTQVPDPEKKYLWSLPAIRLDGTLATPAPSPAPIATPAPAPAPTVRLVSPLLQPLPIAAVATPNIVQNIVEIPRPETAQLQPAIAAAVPYTPAPAAVTVQVQRVLTETSSGPSANNLVNAESTALTRPAAAFAASPSPTSNQTSSMPLILAAVAAIGLWMMGRNKP